MKKYYCFFCGKRVKWHEHKDDPYHPAHHQKCKDDWAQEAVENATELQKLQDLEEKQRLMY